MGLQGQLAPRLRCATPSRLRVGNPQPSGSSVPQARPRLSLASGLKWLDCDPLPLRRRPHLHGSSLESVRAGQVGYGTAADGGERPRTGQMVVRMVVKRQRSDRHRRPPPADPPVTALPPRGMGTDGPPSPAADARPQEPSAAGPATSCSSSPVGIPECQTIPVCPAASIAGPGRTGSVPAAFPWISGLATDPLAPARATRPRGRRTLSEVPPGAGDQGPAARTGAVIGATVSACGSSTAGPKSRR
jgi:hypothetical protein